MKTTYEIFKDGSYYGMWCVRDPSDRNFNSPKSYHFALKKDAEEFFKLLHIAK